MECETSPPRSTVLWRSKVDDAVVLTREQRWNHLINHANKCVLRVLSEKRGGVGEHWSVCVKLGDIIEKNTNDTELTITTHIKVKLNCRRQWTLCHCYALHQKIVFTLQCTDFTSSPYRSFCIFILFSELLLKSIDFSDTICSYS